MAIIIISHIGYNFWANRNYIRDDIEVGDCLGMQKKSVNSNVVMVYLRSGEVMDYLLSLFSVKKLAVPSIWNLQNSSNGLFIDFYQNINSNEGLKIKIVYTNMFSHLCFR